MPSAPTAADQLPLVFHAAPGWPTPTLDWVSTHLAWQPPPGWVPVAGCPHSPPRWTFWSRNDAAWNRMARPHLRSPRRNYRWGTGLCLLFVGYTVLGVVGGTMPLWRILLQLVVLVVVAVKTWQAREAIRQIEADLLADIRNAAALLKATSDRAHYERYLRSSGDT